MKQKLITLNFLLIFVQLTTVSGYTKNSDPILLTSPDNKYEFSLVNENQLFYSVSWSGELIISKSALGFQLEDATSMPANAKIERVTRNSKNENWNPVYGERKTYTDNYNEMLVELSAANPNGEGFAIRVRAYNEGIAFRYEFNQGKPLNIRSELTEYTFVNDPTVWVSSRAQSPIEKQKLSEVSFIAERPLLAEVSDSVYIALGEAALIDFARMKFEKDFSTPNKLKASLEIASADSDRKGTVSVPGNEYKTPWRYIMAGATPAEILQNNFLLLNLNEPNSLSNTSFIKPGKVIREVTLTTTGGIACVDFAAKHNLQFVEFDAGWYGNEYDDASDATTVTVDPKRSPGPLDLRHVINYAKGKGIGIILYINRRALEKQLDEVLPLLKSWGVAGVKYGFVNVGPQEWTSWLHDAIRKAAKYELMVDVHDEYRPTGYSRTYPNLMTQEGIRGDEESPSVEHSLNTLFTRMIAGAGDNTNCFLAARVTEKMGGKSGQMAKAILLYSPWQFVFWYDRPEGSPVKKGGAGAAESVIHESPELAFFDALPTVWDDTKVMEGRVGGFATIARKNGDNWFVGSLTSNRARKVELPLSFLDENAKYEAKVFFQNSTDLKENKVSIETLYVSSKIVLSRDLAENSGFAIILTKK